MQGYASPAGRAAGPRAERFCRRVHSSAVSACLKDCGMADSRGSYRLTTHPPHLSMAGRVDSFSDRLLEQELANQALHHRRLRIEHVNSSVKRCRVVKDRIRLWKAGVRDLVMDICCALHNFRVRLTPWQPMI